MADDSLDDLAEVFEDFGFGFDDEAGDPNVRPARPPPPLVVKGERTSTSITLQFLPQKQSLIKLVVQAMPLTSNRVVNPFDGFGTTSKIGGRMTAVKDAASANRAVVVGLRPETPYTFRLVATNPAGCTEGEPSQAVFTAELAPAMGDLAAWLWLCPSIRAKGGKVSKLSLRRKPVKPRRLWFVLEGAHMTWYDRVAGDALGTLDFSNVIHIDSDDVVRDTEDAHGQILLMLKGDKSICIRCASRDPELSSQALHERWLRALRKAQAGTSGEFGNPGNTALLM